MAKTSVNTLGIRLFTRHLVLCFDLRVRKNILRLIFTLIASSPATAFCGGIACVDEWPVLLDVAQPITLEYLKQYPKTVQDDIDAKILSPGELPKLLREVERMIDGFRTSGSSLWPSALPRTKAVTLEQYFQAIKREGPNSIHYAKTLRHHWDSRRQFIELDLPEPQLDDLNEFKNEVRRSCQFEAAARFFGLSRAQLIGSD